VPDLAGLVVDWGGVLTSDLGVALAAWAASDGIEYAAYTRCSMQLPGTTQLESTAQACTSKTGSGPARVSG